MWRVLVVLALAGCPGKPVPDPETLDDAFDALAEATVTDAPVNLIATDGAYGVALRNASFDLYDLTDPRAPALTASYDGLAGSDQRFVFTDDTIYALVSGDGGVHVYDLVRDAGAAATPAHHAVLPEMRLPVAVADEVFYAQDGLELDAIHAFDLRGLAAAPAGDVAVTATTTLEVGVGGLFELRVERGLLHAASSRGLLLFDLTDPLAPTTLSRIGLAQIDAYVYDGDHVVVMGVGPSQVVDLGDPAAPVARGTFDVPRPNGPIAIQDGYLYVPTGGGLYIVDVSERAAPDPVKTLTIFPDPQVVAPVGEQLIVGSPTYYRVYAGNRP